MARFAIAGLEVIRDRLARGETLGKLLQRETEVQLERLSRQRLARVELRQRRRQANLLGVGARVRQVYQVDPREAKIVARLDQKTDLAHRMQRGRAQRYCSAIVGGSSLIARTDAGAGPWYSWPSTSVMLNS